MTPYAAASRSAARCSSSRADSVSARQEAGSGAGAPLSPPAPTLHPPGLPPSGCRAVHPRLGTNSPYARAAWDAGRAAVGAGAHRGGWGSSSADGHADRCSSTWPPGRCPLSAGPDPPGFRRASRAIPAEWARAKARHSVMAEARARQSDVAGFAHLHRLDDGIGLRVLVVHGASWLGSTDRGAGAPASFFAVGWRGKTVPPSVLYRLFQQQKAPPRYSATPKARAMAAVQSG